MVLISEVISNVNLFSVVVYLIKELLEVCYKSMVVVKIIVKIILNSYNVRFFVSFLIMLL